MRPSQLKWAAALLFGFWSPALLEAKQQNKDGNEFNLGWADPIISKTEKFQGNAFVTVRFQSGIDPKTKEEVTPPQNLPLVFHAENEIKLGDDICIPVLDMYSGRLPDTFFAGFATSPAAGGARRGFFGVPTVFVARRVKNVQIRQTVEAWRVDLVDRDPVTCLAPKVGAKDRFPRIDTFDPMPSPLLVKKVAKTEDTVYIDTPGLYGFTTEAVLAPGIKLNKGEVVIKKDEMATYIVGDCGAQRINYYKIIWSNTIGLTVVDRADIDTQIGVANPEPAAPQQISKVINPPLGEPDAIKAKNGILIIAIGEGGNLQLVPCDE